MLTPLPGPGIARLSSPSPRTGKDASEEDIATLAVRSALTAMADNPEAMFEEALAVHLSLEVSKRH